MLAGTYRVQKDAVLLIWAKEWPQEFVAWYRRALEETGKLTYDGTFPVRNPLGYKVKAGQEIVLEWGTRTKLDLPPIGEQAMAIYAIDVIVRVGTKVYTGVTLAYNDCYPSVIADAHGLRSIKKRK